MKMTNMTISEVNLSKIPDLISGELSEVFIRYCCFCGKKCQSIDENNKLREKMSGDEGFYCSFCIRNNYQNKGKKDVLILSFRSVFGFFYYNNYLMGIPHKLWLVEIQKYIDSHKETGLQNPLFVYDDDTMLWFVDFSRIGTTGKRQPLDEVHKTIVNIFACFNFYETAPELNVKSFFKKYKDSIDDFYARRYRPENRQMLIPTFNKCGLNEQKLPTEKLRNFVFKNSKNI